MHQLIIIGGGPAGISASIYAQRKRMDFLLITKEVGGQVLKAHKNKGTSPLVYKAIKKGGEKGKEGPKVAI